MKSDFSTPLVSQQFSATTLSNFLTTVRHLELGQLVHAKILQAQIQSEILIVTAKGSLTIPNPFPQLDPRDHLLLRIVADAQFPAFTIEHPTFNPGVSTQAELHKPLLRLPQPLLNALQQQPQLLLKFQQSLAAEAPGTTGVRIEGRPTFTSPTPSAGLGIHDRVPIHSQANALTQTQRGETLTTGIPSPIQRTLKTNLPKQQPLQLFFAALPKLLQALLRTISTQPGSEVVQALKTYVDSIPDRNHIAEPDTVKSQLQYSGNGLENRLLRLANQETTEERPFDRDLKAVLIKLSTLIQEHPKSSPATGSQGKRVPRPTTDQPTPIHTVSSSPPRSTPSHVRRSVVQQILTRLTQTQADLDPAMQHPRLVDLNPELFEYIQPIEAALAKVLINQTASLKVDLTMPFFWLTDIPVKTSNGYDVFEIHIQEEGRGAQEQSGKSKTWTVSIRFDLEHLGPVKAIVQLVQERIQVRFIAQRESTVALLQQHLPELEQNLKQANLLPQSMIIQQGEASPYQMTFADTLLDVTI